jgi:hypothetical protein
MSSLAAFAYGESVSESSLEFAKLLRFKIDFTGMSEKVRVSFSKCNVVIIKSMYSYFVAFLSS